MKTLLALLLIVMAVPAFAQQPQFTLGANAQSLTNQLALSWEGEGPNIEAVTGKATTVIQPYVDIHFPRVATVRYSYTPALENKFVLTSSDKFTLWGIEFKEDSRVDLTANTHIHRWEIFAGQYPVMPYVLMENWRTQFKAISDEDTAESSLNRFVLGLGVATYQPINTYALFAAKGCYSFLNGSRGYLLDASLSIADPLLNFPTYSKIGYSYREVSFAGDIHKRFKQYGPYLRFGVRF